MRYTFEVIIEKGADGVFVARCSSVPDCVAQGDTAANAVASLKDVITRYLKRDSGETNSGDTTNSRDT